MRKLTRRLDREYATEIGAAALVYLTEDRDRLVRFLELTGVSPDELRQQAQSPALLGALLEHLLGDESMLLVFAASAGLDPQLIGPARELLQRQA